MAIQDDWTLNYTAKTITHSAGTTIYTVLALYSWLMDLFDDASQMDDDVPMAAQTPTEFSLINGWSIPDSSIEDFLKGGALTDTADDTVFGNIYTIGSDGVISNITLYVVQNGAVLFTAAAAGHIDKLVKVKNAGTLIDSGMVTVFAREWGYTYDHYEMDMSAGGRQPAPIAVSADSNNTTAVGTVGAYTATLAFGSYTEDVDQSGTDENYEAVVDLKSTYGVDDAYEYLKYLTRRGETGLVDGVQGQLYTAADAAYAEVKAAPLGTFAGGKFFGARGLYFLLSGRPAAEANKYELIDSDGNTQITEPTSITVQITSLDAADRVLVALASAGDLVTDQYATAASGNLTGSSTVTLTSTPAADTPSSGVLRITGKRYEYSSYSGAVFTLDTTAHPTGLEEDNNSADVYIPWLDKTAGGSTASVGVSYAADRDVIARVRQKGILPFESPGAITSTGLSIAAIRTTDNIVS
ncbi:MAG: hypothetical protein KAT62_00810 [Desulfuromonadales bacterium]|nr:hypothetical protein [Desulfuromonadales bacterium]